MSAKLTTLMLPIITKYRIIWILNYVLFLFSSVEFACSTVVICGRGEGERNLKGLEFLESGPKVSPQVTPHIITGRQSSRNYVVPGVPVISIITRPVLPSVLSTRPPPALLFPVLPVIPVIFAFLYFPSQNNFNS